MWLRTGGKRTRRAFWCRNILENVHQNNLEDNGRKTLILTPGKET